MHRSAADVFGDRHRRLKSCLAAVAICLLCAGPLGAQGIFIRGDCTQDLELNIADPVNLLGHLFLGGTRPDCRDACDFDDNGSLEITDAIGTLGYLFLAGVRPLPPFPGEDVDPTEDGIECANGKLPVIALRVTPEVLVIYNLAEVQPLSVLGILGGGAPGESPVADLTAHPNTTYSIEPAGVAAVSLQGAVTPIAPGEAAISVRHRALTARANVRVVASAGGAPALRVLSPPAGAVLVSASARVSGVVSDPAARVTVNGAALVVEAGTGAFATAVALSPGPNRIEVVATNDRGEGRAELTVVRAAAGSPEAIGPDGEPLPVLPEPFIAPPDLKPPRVAVDAPRAGAVLLSRSVEVQGTVDDAQARVRVNGVAADVSNGRFAARIVLPRGTGSIEAEAVDPAGNRAASAIEVTIDAEIPSVTILEPPPSDLGGHGTFPEDVSVVSQPSLTVRGRLSHSGMRVSIQGLPAVVNGNQFEGTATLRRGINRVAVLAELPGDAPRSALAVRRALLDLDPPEIELTFPPDEFRTARTPVLLAGRVRDPGAPPGAVRVPRVEVNGAAVDVRGGGFEASAALVAGQNRITLRAIDGVGRETVRQVTVYMDPFALATLEAVDGAGQSAKPGAALPRSFAVRARDGGGQPAAGLPVIFEVVAGDGLLAGGVRERVVATDAAGEARSGFIAGRAAGRGLHVVTARTPNRIGSPVAFAVSVEAGPLAALVSHSPRWRRGTAGFPLARPLAVRALDSSGNPVSDVLVDFDATAGRARISGGVRASVRTDAAGIAAATLLPDLPDPADPAGEDGRILVAASGPDGRRVVFEVHAPAPGAAADTAASGRVVDLDGLPLGGIEVRAAEPAGASSVTDGSGRFLLAGLPGGVGAALLEFREGQGGAAGFEPHRREVALSLGRRTPLSEPVRLFKTSAGSRAGEAVVSETSGGTAAVPALPGLRLEIAPGSAFFPDGSRRGKVTVLAAPLDAFPSAVPDAVAIDFPFAVLPEGIRFDPPARVHVPNAGVPNAGQAGGRELSLFWAPAGAGGFFESGLGRIGDDRAFVSTLAGLGVTGGGVHLFALPGPAGGQAVAVAGAADAGGPGIENVLQRAESPAVGFQVLAHSGEFFLEEVDLEIRGRGLEYRFLRRYESRHGFQGSLGWNWEHEYADRRLVELAGGGNVLRCDGRGRFDEYLRHGDAFISPVGGFARLFVDGEGHFIEREPDGTRYRYRPFDGSTFAGRLEAVIDRSGNRLAIEPDAGGRIAAVRDPMGRRVEYSWDAVGRIREVRDFAGRRVFFEYDGDGNLASATGPAVIGTPNGNDFPAGRKVRYVYREGSGDRRLDHNLLEAFAPNEARPGEAPSGPPWLVNRFDEDPRSPGFDRVISQDWGGTNGSGVAAGGRLSIEYRLAREDSSEGAEPGSDPGAALLVDGGTTVLIDRRGLRTEIDWNRFALATSVRRFTRGISRPRAAGTFHPGVGIDPPFYETRFSYTEEGLLREAIRPRGDRTIYERNEASPLRSVRHAVVREIRVPAPGADGAPSGTPAATVYGIEPIFCRRVRVVSPRGNEEGAAPERFTTVHFMDYQEGSDLARLAAEAGVSVPDLDAALRHAGIEMGLGDLNGDGTASLASGNIVRTNHPPITLLDGTIQEAQETYRHNPFGQVLAETGPEGAVTRYRYHPENDPEGDGSVSGEPGLDPNTGGYLAERTIDADAIGSFPPARIRTRWFYSPWGDAIRAIDGAGNETQFHWTAARDLVEVRSPAPFHYRLRFRYDASRNRVSEEIENWTATPDGLPLPVRENPWIETAWTHDILGRVVEERREISGGEVGPERSAATAYRYDPNGNPFQTIHPEGNFDERSYDDRDVPLEVRRGLGTGLDPGTEWVERFDQDENGNLVRVTGPADLDGDGAMEATSWRYDGFDRLAARIDPSGGTWSYERDVEGNIVSRAFLGAAGVEESASGGNVLLSRTRSFFDERGREFRTVAPRFGADVAAEARAEPPAETETRFFDRAGHVVRRVDALGGVWTEERDGAGRLVRSVDPAGNRTTRHYDAAGNLRAEVREVLSDAVVDAAAGVAGDPDYDPSGRLRATWTTAYLHDSLGRLVVRVEPSGRTRRWRHDSRGNAIHTSDGSGTVVHAATDPELAELLPFLAPRQAADTNAPGNQAHFDFDGLNRMARAVYEMRKNGQGQLDIDHTNPFNDDGLIEERFDWDLNGRLVAWTDDRGGRTEVAHDRLERVRSIAEPGGGGETYECDAAGNRTVSTTRSGTRIRQTFDRFGRVVRREIEPPAGGSIEGTTLQRFGYDGLGRPTLAFDSNGAETADDDSLVLRAYDSLGRLTSECHGPYAVRIERDGGGRAAEILYPGGRRLSIERDGLGRSLSVREGTQLRAAFSYIGPERILGRDLGGVLRQSYLGPDEQGVLRLDGLVPPFISSCADGPEGSDPASASRQLAGDESCLCLPTERANLVAIKERGRKRSWSESLRERDAEGGRRRRSGCTETCERRHADDGGQVDREEYRGLDGALVLGSEHAHDRAGRVLHARRLHRLGRGWAIRYDSVGRTREFQPDLLDPRVPPVNPTVFTRLYPDGAHNWRLSIVDFVEQRIEVDPLDELTSVGSEAIGHDAEGNIAAAGSIELRYDGLGRLVRVLRGGQTVLRLGYDAAGAWDPRDFRHKGRRIWRESLAGDPREPVGPVRTIFLDESPLEERAGLRGVIRQYVHGPDGRASGFIDAAAGWRWFYYLHDGLGSVVGLADERGKLLEEVIYDLFGVPSFRSPTDTRREESESVIPTRIFHRGEFWEPLPRLYTIGARHFSADLGRFIDRAAPPEPPRPLGMNRYAPVTSDGRGP